MDAYVNPPAPDDIRTDEEFGDWFRKKRQWINESLKPVCDQYISSEGEN